MKMKERLRIISVKGGESDQVNMATSRVSSSKCFEISQVFLEEMLIRFTKITQLPITTLKYNMHNGVIIANS